MVRLILLTAGVMCVTAIAVRYLPGVVAQTASSGAAWPEFTATVVKEDLSSATGSVGTTVSSVAVHKDGSRAELRHTVNGKLVNSKVVVDTSAGTRTVVDPATKSLTTYNLSKGEVAALRYSPGSCDAALVGDVVEPLQPEAEPILGYEVLKATTETKVNLGSDQPVIRRVNWLAPTLGCYALKTVSQTVTGDGKPIGTTTINVTAVTPGDPDPALFELPAYTERAPSEVFEEKARIEGKPCVTCGKTGVSQQDTAYHSSRGVRQ